jgi:hypothetical protein
MVNRLLRFVAHLGPNEPLFLMKNAIAKRFGRDSVARFLLFSLRVKLDYSENTVWK